MIAVGLWQNNSTRLFNQEKRLVELGNVREKAPEIVIVRSRNVDLAEREMAIYFQETFILKISQLIVAKRLVQKIVSEVYAEL